MNTEKPNQITITPEQRMLYKFLRQRELRQQELERLHQILEVAPNVDISEAELNKELAAFDGPALERFEGIVRNFYRECALRSAKESVTLRPGDQGALPRIREQAGRWWLLGLNQIEEIRKIFNPPPPALAMGFRRGNAGDAISASTSDRETQLSALDPTLPALTLLPMGCKAIRDQPNRYVLMFKVRQEPFPSEPPQVRLWIGETPVAIEMEYEHQQGRLNLIWTWERPLVVEPIELGEMENGTWEVRLLLESSPS